MSSTIAINNLGSGPFSHPEFPGGIAAGATESRVLKQVNADDYSNNYATLAEMGIEITVDGTLAAGSEAFTSADTIADTTHIVRLDSTAGIMTMVLPVAATVGAGHTMYIILDVDGGDVTIDGDSAETVDGNANVVMTAAGETLNIVSDGVSNWALL